MTREELLKTIRRCTTDGSAECAECYLRDAKGDCIARLLQACEEEIVFMDSLISAHEEINNVLRTQLEKARKELNGWKTES